MTIAATRFGSPEYRKALRKQGRSEVTTKLCLGCVQQSERLDTRTVHTPERRVNRGAP